MDAEVAPAEPHPSPGAADAPAGRMPDFFIVGHAKCGTTALYEMLRRHPQIYMPGKEPRFFAIKEIDLDGTSVVSETPGRRRRTLEGYLELFAQARPDQVVGDATPLYLRSTMAARRIASVKPDARIIAILREPVSFLRSFHLQSVRNYEETEKDFAKAIALEEARRQGRCIPRMSRRPEDLLYSDHVRYVEQLRRYREVFPEENVRVLIYEDFRRDNEATVRAVLGFLEVDDTVPVQAIKTQPSRDLRFRRLHRLVQYRRRAKRDLAVGRALSLTVSGLTPKPLRGRARASWRRVAFEEPHPPDAELLLELRRRFKPEVVALSDYLGRDLVTLWGYGDVA
jgi:Sulfotransferase family